MRSAAALRQARKARTELREQLKQAVFYKDMSGDTLKIVEENVMNVVSLFLIRGLVPCEMFNIIFEYLK